MVAITKLSVHDIRFPTSEGMHGSDAVHSDPDYSAAYCIIETDIGGLNGHGLTFTIGRGNEIVKVAIEALEHLIVGKSLESITSDFGQWWKSLVNDGQLRWLGPEKGVVHMAVGALVNAVWDLWGKHLGKPVWRILYDMTPAQLVSLIDFRWITDAITPAEALDHFTKMQVGKEERLAHLLAHGYQAYTTSAGWLGYTEEELRQKCRTGVAEGWTHFKAKVGVSIPEDIARLRIIRSEIGDRTLMVDANQRWDVNEAVEYMKALAEFKPWFIEEPTCADDILGHLAIKNALKPYNIQVATGEVCQNRVMFKQFLMSGAMDICQIDSCRVAGVNELLSIMLMAAKYKVPVCPHAGGVGLCEYVQHLAMFDYLCIGGKQNIIEYVNHLHEHFKHPSVIVNGCYQVPTDAGYSVELFPDSIADYTFPTGKQWVERLRNKTSRQIVSQVYKGLVDLSPVVPASSELTYLITGGQGFVGAWTIKHILAETPSARVIVHDLKHDDHILSQILSINELSKLVRVYGDICDSAAVQSVILSSQPDHIIHLAGLQIPTCRVNPAAGAKVNVVGTVNVFDAAVKLKAIKPLKNIIYASSAALCGPPGDYKGDTPEVFNHQPRTQYGVYKLASEGNARVFWQDHGIVSVALRPLTVFGVGREIGMTSGPTKAIKAAVLGRRFDVPFSGKTSFNDVRDVAKLFVLSAQKATTGASVCGIKGVVSTVENFMAIAEKVFPALSGKYTILPNAPSLPFPSHFEEKNLEQVLGSAVPVSSLEESVAAMVAKFQELHSQGRLSDSDLV